MARKPLGLVLLAAAWATCGAWAADRWEADSVPGGGDDEPVTANELVVGARQLHDTESAVGLPLVPDRDWMYVDTKAGHSYEVRTSGANIRFRSAGCSLCTSVDRVDSGGTVLTGGFAPEGAGPVDGISAQSQVVRWIGTVDQRDWIRVFGDGVIPMTANDQYEVELRDTTYFVPRWNQSGTQSTVFLIQNTGTGDVTGSILFYDAAGVLLAATPLAVPLHGVQVVQAGSVSGLANQSGSAAIVHTGGSGALAGKAVALEPATGFTFDTLIVQSSR